MTTQQVADRLVKLVREGKNLQAIDELYADDIISKEPKGHPHELTRGKQDVKNNTQAFEESVVEIHAISASHPIVTGNHFAYSLEIDATYKERGRSKLGELCVYEVRSGKVISDEFFYSMG
jgi:hypothetical protein